MTMASGASVLEQASVACLSGAGPQFRTRLCLVGPPDLSRAPVCRLGPVEVERWWRGEGGRQGHAYAVGGGGQARGGDVSAVSLPEPVRAALTALLSAAGVSAAGPAGLSAGEPAGVSAAGAAGLSAAGSFAVTGADAAGALAVIEASEAVQAWAAWVGVGATRALHQGFREQLLFEVEQADASKTRRERAEAEVRDATCAEIEAATGIGSYEARRRLGLALAPPAATATVTALLGAGVVSYFRARTVVEDTAALPPDVADAIAADALSQRRDGAPRPQSQAQFRARLRTLIRRHYGPQEAATVEHDQAVKARRVDALLSDNGTGELIIDGDTPRVVAAMDRINRIARRFRANGDTRTLDQLRSDVAVDLLLYGWVPPKPKPQSKPPSRGEAADAGPGADAAADPMTAYRKLGESPPAHVEVVVALTTLLGWTTASGRSPATARSAAPRPDRSPWPRDRTGPGSSPIR